MGSASKKTEGFSEARKHLEDAGIWPENNDVRKIPKFRKFVFSWFFVLEYIMLLGLVGHMYKSFESGQTSAILDDIFVLLTATVIISSVMMSFIRGRRIVKLLMEISEPNEYLTAESAERINKHVDKLTVAFYFYSVLNNLVFLIISYVFDYQCHELKKTGNGEGYICGLLHPSWYPIKLDHTLWIYIIHLIEVIEVMYYVPKAACSCIFFYACIIFTEERINNLKSLLKNTEVTDSNAEEVKQMLKYAAASYSDVNQLVNDINSTIGMIFSPSQHVLLGLIISILEYQAVVEKTGTATSTLIFWFVFESLTCWKGQSLEDASVSLAEQVYEFPWYDLDPSAKSIYKIFLGQVQVKLQLKCPPMVTINLAFFYEVMKRSYSLLMYLQNMYA